jgi:hypothetical protein
MLPIESIVRDTDAWPRVGIHRDRVAGFVELLEAEGPDALPPLVVIPTEDNPSVYLLADGWHRFEALRQLDYETVPVTIRANDHGSSSLDTAYALGCSTCATASMPLTLPEKRAAVERRLSTHPSDSDRSIAKLTGSSHTTVSRIRGELAARLLQRITALEQGLPVRGTNASADERDSSSVPTPPKPRRLARLMLCAIDELDVDDFTYELADALDDMAQTDPGERSADELGEALIELVRDAIGRVGELYESQGTDTG